ncbi:MAG: glycosyltransferase family 1 protein [Crenarchaeota archaeon]|nr:MAG: glycosyltransferase family 1 protein [Thermoproteota archaeon]RDJ33337.1 MAG: glycosyltransferase family 1 protein [Thermoproteota archaeon]RDJ36160.1 MAG: glycosyltransferase family 1 protein [Thermoproteota archaeon]RDJ38791.1 MAG: glycosyltransferase family 1 protein [Thermoproteota archaeon]
MEKKIRCAFIYNKKNEFLTGRFFDNTYYNFFIKALRRNQRLDVKNYPVETKIDVSEFNDKHDVILLFDNNYIGTPHDVIGREKIDIPVISRVGDPHWAKKLHSKEFHDKWKIDYYFGFQHPDSFYQFYPNDYKYKTIIFGLESSLYQKVIPFRNRIKSKILNSGAIGTSKIFPRILSKIKNPELDINIHYKLRTLCNKLPYVVHTPTLSHEYVNDKYPELLNKYFAAIAATTYFPTIKYWEIPAAECLTFMEVNDKNKAEYLGFEDNKSAIFINEQNYTEKFEEYLHDTENKKWEEIAHNGRTHAMNYLNNDRATESLVDLMEELI